MKKFYLDVGLLAMLIAVMNFHFLPKVLHEVLGLAMFFAVAVHFYWNVGALRSLPKIFLIIDVMLLVAICTVVATGACISNHIFNGLVDMKIQRNITIHQLHVSIPFVTMILIGLHLGRNWTGFYQRLKKVVGVEIPALAEKIIVGVSVGVGIVGLYLDQLPDRLLMKHIFGTAATQLPSGGYILIMIGMTALFTAIGFFVDRLIKKF